MGIYIGISNQIRNNKNKAILDKDWELFLVLDENTNTHVTFLDSDEEIFGVIKL